jgi:hypothetical protein
MLLLRETGGTKMQRGSADLEAPMKTSREHRRGVAQSPRYHQHDKKSLRDLCEEKPNVEWMRALVCCMTLAGTQRSARPDHQAANY